MHAHVYAECIYVGYINVFYTRVLAYREIFSGCVIKSISITS